MSPLSMTAAASYAECQINGKIVDCGQLPAWFGYLTVGFPLMMFVVFGLMIVSSWFIFQKAGKPGWASLIPIYNVVVMLEIIGRPTWWVLLMFVPFVNVIVGLMMLFKLVKVFGKGFGFGLGSLFLPFIFLPILAFGKSVYTRPEGSPSEGTKLS